MDTYRGAAVAGDRSDSTCTVRASTMSSPYESPNVQSPGPWAVTSPTTKKAKVIMSPAPDYGSDAHLRVALSLGTSTNDIVVASLTNAIASVRSGEVARVGVKRVLHLNRTEPSSIASSVQDLTPKKVSTHHAKVQFF